MAETTERITQGLSVQRTNVEPVTEPVTLSDIKDYISMDDSLSIHDGVLNSLITGFRILIEDKLGISLIARNVVVSWRMLYDFERLPYQPINGDVIVTDLDEVVLDSEDYYLRGVGGFLEIVGDFPNGITLAYLTKPVDKIEPIQEAIKAMIYSRFIERKSIQMAFLENASLLSI